MDVGSEVRNSLIGAVGDVHGHSGLGQDGDVDPGSDGDPVVELRAEREADARNAEPVAQQLGMKLVREVLLALVHEESLLVEEGAYGQHGVESEHQRLADQGANHADGGVNHVVVALGVGARIGQIGSGEGTPGRIGEVDVGGHVDAGGASLEADVALHGQPEQADLQLRLGVGQERGIEVGGRRAAGKHPCRDSIAARGRADELHGAGGVGRAGEEAKGEDDDGYASRADVTAHARDDDTRPRFERGSGRAVLA